MEDLDQKLAQKPKVKRSREVLREIPTVTREDESAPLNATFALDPKTEKKTEKEKRSLELLTRLTGPKWPLQTSSFMFRQKKVL